MPTKGDIFEPAGELLDILRLRDPVALETLYQRLGIDQETPYEEVATAVKKTLIPDENSIRSRKDLEQKLDVFTEIEAFLAVGLTGRKDGLDVSQREKLLYIIDDLTDMLCWMRGVNPSSWEQQGLERRYQELRGKMSGYISQEMKDLEGPFYSSPLIKKLLAEGKLNDDTTPLMPALMNMHIPKFTGAGLEAISRLDEYDREAAFAAMTGFQNLAPSRESWRFTELPINMSGPVTEARVTEAQIEREEIQYIIPNTVLERLAYLGNLSHAVRSGLELSAEAKELVARIGKRELEILDTTINELNLYIHKVHEILGDYGRLRPSDTGRFDPRELQGIFLQDMVAGIDTSLVDLRRVEREDELARLYSDLYRMVGPIQEVYSGSVLMPKFMAWQPKVKQGEDLTPAEARLAKTNYFTLACEQLGLRPEDMGVSGPGLEETLRAVKEAKTELAKVAVMERKQLVFDSIYDKLMDASYDPKSLEAIGQLIEHDKQLSSLESLVYSTGREVDLFRSTQARERLREQGKAVATAYLDEMSQRFERGNLNASRELIDKVTKAAEYSGRTEDYQLLERLRERLDVMNDVLRNMRSFGSEKSFATLSFRSAPGSSSPPLGEYSNQFTQAISAPVGYEQSVEPSTGDSSRIREGARLNYHATIFAAVQIAIAAAEASGSTIWLDPETRNAQSMPMEEGEVRDCIGMLSSGRAYNVRGSPFAGNQEYWEKGLRYDLGQSIYLCLTQLGRPGSGLAEDGSGTRTLVVVAERTPSGYERFISSR